MKNNIKTPIATIGLPLSWGEEGTLIDEYSTDMLDGKSLSKVGFTAFDEKSKLLNAMLSNCYMAKVFRMDMGGEKAKASIDGLTLTAKYAGVLGNELIVSITKEDALFNVNTFIKAALKDTQKVSAILELVSNDWVEFGGTGELTENAGVMLADGKDGIVTKETTYTRNILNFYPRRDGKLWQSQRQKQA